MPGSKHYFVRRVIQSIFVLWIISIIAFTITRLTPGNPVAVAEDPFISSETIQRINKSLGLNEPIPVQYIRWLGIVLHGNLGRSYVDSRPVIDKIWERFPATLELTITARVIGLLGIPLGIYAALHRGERVDNIVRFFTVVGSATPHWWLGLMVLVFIGSPTGLIPLGGMYTIGKEGVVADRLWHLFLPATIFAMSDWIMWSRYMRSQALEELVQDYIRTAHAKGIKWHSIIIRHVLPNTMIPAVTIFGDSLASFVSGSVTLETVFSWPGIGRLTFLAALQRDYPVVMAMLMITAFLVSFGNLLADLLYTWIDPRVKL
jgi:peptide/nickel transport system permease protein